MYINRPAATWWAAVIAVGLAACGHEPTMIEKVEAFRAARDAGRYDDAQRYLSSDPRAWFDSRDGEGSPLKLGAGPYKQWDEFFHSRGDHEPWKVEGRTVWAVATEMNDYYRLIERQDTPTYRITYFFDDDGLIEGYMISDAHPGEPSPPKVSREDEFMQWAAETHPDEWSYLRPGGELDPSGDRAQRTRVLLEEWRETVGLPHLDLDTGESQHE
jgi:hypothetical protein